MGMSLSTTRSIAGPLNLTALGIGSVIGTLTVRKTGYRLAVGN
jgi:hypothetical protein